MATNILICKVPMISWYRVVLFHQDKITIFTIQQIKMFSYRVYGGCTSKVSSLTPGYSYVNLFSYLQAEKSHLTSVHAFCKQSVFTIQKGRHFFVTFLHSGN